MQSDQYLLGRCCLGCTSELKEKVRTQHSLKLSIITDMPPPGALSRRSLDDAHLVFSKRPVKRSSSCLHITNLEIPSLENIRYSDTPGEQDCNARYALRVENPNYRALIKKPKKNANTGVASQTGSSFSFKAENEFTLATKQKADNESTYLKKRNNGKQGASLLSTGKWSQISTNTRKNMVSIPEIVGTADHDMLNGDELLRSKTKNERNSDSKLQGLNKSFSEARWSARETKIDNGALSGLEGTIDNGPGLKKFYTRKTVADDDFRSFRSSSSGRTRFEGAESTYTDKLTSTGTSFNFLKSESSSSCQKDGHAPKPKGLEFGMYSRVGNLASGKPLQRAAKHGMAEKISPQNLSQPRKSLHHTGSLPSERESTCQQSYNTKILKEEFQGTSTTEWEPKWSAGTKPRLLMNYTENLIRAFVSMMSIFLKRAGFDVAPLEQITRDGIFVEGSFIIRFGSQIAVLIFIILVLSCSGLVLKILLLKIEVARLHRIVERCRSTTLDPPSNSLLDVQPFELTLGSLFQLAFGKHVTKFALPLIVLVVSLLWKEKMLHFQELCRKYIMGIEEDAPLGKRLAYGVDILFSTRPYMKPTALLLATILLICGGGFALFVVSDDSLPEAMWRAWTYVADSGNHADSEGMWPRIVSLLISFGGMLIFALMLGLISDAISEKVDSLRKGKSEVIESGHTLILGWSDKLGSLLKQLAIANQSLGGGIVVVLAERDKEEMEIDIAKLEFDFMGTSVICRSGSPLIMADLKKVSVSKARAIIVLAEIDNADQSDARALRVVLSLTGIKEGLKGHVVVEMRDLDNETLVKLVGGQMVETVVAHDVIGRLMIQCARQPGLAQIWEDILGFENAEFYIKRWPELDGTCFGDVLISFPDAVPCGVKVKAEGGRIFINPDDDYVLSEGDEILVIAEDDDTYAPAPLPQVQRRSLPRVVMPPNVPEKILLCGWRRDIQDMIKVLDAFLAPGSELWIFSDVPECDREKKLLYGNLNPDNLENIQLVHREGNTVIRRHLESLPLEEFDSILILADEKLEDTVINADSSSLATLLLIRDIQSKRLPLEFSKGPHNKVQVQTQSSWIRDMHEASNNTIIISEILDSRTKNLVSVSKISDYVLSNELVSMALAMVAEDKQINRVLEELFAEEGNELYIRPAEFYLYDQEVLSFFEIMIRARQREEIVIGYRKASADQAVINPPDKNAPQQWSLQDVFVVLAFEE
ncbi:hypothetical protein GOP47_0017515 [Adiantum capillus-veneris]|uniref:RCK N-terminal domain-containing protein n=1 Tax=Adiantum capillus-veneris TaxID=13818 RepID=A0A9D4UFZ3_ADICA|nr:hypothetical protein GOP47_0017515 [Adiantum capillus-veneris]